MLNRLHVVDERVFHYCSAATLIAILRQKTLRLTDIHHLNDYEERVVGQQAFKTALAQLKDVPTGLAPTHMSYDSLRIEIDDEWALWSNLMTAFVACFSRDRDSLSQWRAYAEDASGFSVGFSTDALRQLGGKLVSVEYDTANQVQEMSTSLSQARQHRESSKIDFMFHISDLVDISASFKNLAFKEENEVRLIRSLPKTPLPSDPKQKVEYEARSGLIVPFLDVSFAHLLNEVPICEVILGPKCRSDVETVERMFANFGFAGVLVSSTRVTYR